MSRIRIKDLELSSAQSILATDGDGEAFYLAGSPGDVSILIYNVNAPMFLDLNLFASNGLSFSPSLTRFELGGLLVKHTAIDCDGYNFSLLDANDILFTANKFTATLSNQFNLSAITAVITTSTSISLTAPAYYLYPFTSATADTGFAGKVFFTDVNSKLKYGTITTQNVAESGNLYFTDTRARNAISEGFGIDYDSFTGVISLDTTYLETNYILNQDSVVQSATFNINGDVKAGSFKSMSNTSTFSPNSLTTAERDAVVDVNNGDIIFNSSVNSLQTYVSGNWENLSTVSGTFTDEDSFVVGDRDGINMDFALSYNFVIDSTKVYLNGVRLQREIDYSETGSNIITLNYPPIPTDVLVVDYIKE